MKALKELCRIFYKRQEKNGYKIIRVFGIKVLKRRIRGNPSIIDAAQRKKGVLLLPRPGACQVGKWSYCGPDLRIDNPKTIIGSFCSIGQRVVIGHGEHPLCFISSSPYLYLDSLGWKSASTPVHNEYWIPDPIVIGNDVWIGEGAFIKNGVRIGDGAVIGAHSCVTKDIPPYAVAVGVPAKVVRYRFPDSVIKRLLMTKWWDLDDEVIRRIPYDNIDEALDFLERL